MRKKSLASGSIIPVVVHEFETPLPQVEHSNVSGGSDAERAAPLKHIESAGAIYCCAGNDLVERHAQVEELRHDIREVDHL